MLKFSMLINKIFRISVLPHNDRLLKILIRIEYILFKFYIRQELKIYLSIIKIKYFFSKISF